MPAKTITVQQKAGHGSTTGNVAYYAEGEPRLLTIREKFLSGERSRAEVLKAVKRITGFERYSKDFDEITKDVSGFNEKIRTWLDYIEEHPLLERVYGNDELIAEFVMAPEVE